MSFEIVPRTLWGAREPLSVVDRIKPATLVILTNTFTRPCNTSAECQREVRRLQSLHMDHQSKPDIRYNFLVCGDGLVYEGRGWKIVPSMPWKHKRLLNGFLVAYVGQYLASELPPAMSVAGHEMLKYAIRQGYISSDFILENHQKMLKEAKFTVRD